MADHKISIDFTGGGSNPYGNSSADLLRSVLERLNTAVEKLNDNINNKGTGSNNISGGMSDNTSIKTKSQREEERQNQLTQAKVDRLFNTAIAAVGFTASRLSSAFASAAVSFAGSQANLAGGYIFGNSSQSGIAGIGNIYDAARNRKKSIASTIGGAVIGGAAGYFGGPLVGITAGNIGANAVDYLINSQTEYQDTIKKYQMQSSLLAAEGEWAAGFSRFGYKKDLNKTDQIGNIAINAPLSSAFENRYRGTLNYNSIISDIMPYASPNSIKNDLNQVAQTFKKAGFTVEEFSKLTSQASQAQAISGKSITEFSKDLLKSRSVYGYGYDTSTNQLALNLQSLGFGENNSKYLAFQSQFNPGILNGINSYLGSDPSSFYANKAISKRYGININKLMMGGSWGSSTTSGFRNTISKELQNFMTNGDYGENLAVLNAIGHNPGEILGWKRNRVAINNNAMIDNDVANSPLDKLAQDQLKVNSINTATLTVGQFILNSTQFSNQQNNNNPTKK